MEWFSFFWLQCFFFSNWNISLFLIGIFSFFLTFRVLYFSFWNCTLLLKSKYSCYFFMIFLKIRYSLAVMEWYAVLVGQIIPRTMDTQWRHESKKYEYLGWCGRQNMLRPYLNIWEWEWIFGRAVKASVVRGLSDQTQNPKSEKFGDFLYIFVTWINELIFVKKIRIGRFKSDCWNVMKLSWNFKPL